MCFVLCIHILIRCLYFSLHIGIYIILHHVLYVICTIVRLSHSLLKATWLDLTWHEIWNNMLFVLYSYCCKGCTWNVWKSQAGIWWWLESVESWWWLVVGGGRDDVRDEWWDGDVSPVWRPCSPAVCQPLTQTHTLCWFDDTLASSSLFLSDHLTLWSLKAATH